mmetsp:Transcript_12493/g.22154  ORF Transcript_12493/g.22154 Transcript_12493/m.22154 type:complete len:298 (-) Transcript_12493:65-958(-)
MPNLKIYTSTRWPTYKTIADLPLGVDDVDDMCASGTVGWTSNANTDYDGDGCQDGGEDQDDDGDGVNNPVDLCPHTKLKAKVDDQGCSRAQVKRNRQLSSQRGGGSSHEDMGATAGSVSSTTDGEGVGEGRGGDRGGEGDGSDGGGGGAQQPGSRQWFQGVTAETAMSLIVAAIMTRVWRFVVSFFQALGLRDQLVVKGSDSASSSSSCSPPPSLPPSSTLPSPSGNFSSPSPTSPTAAKPVLAAQVRGQGGGGDGGANTTSPSIPGAVRSTSAPTLTTGGYGGRVGGAPFLTNSGL